MARIRIEAVAPHAPPAGFWELLALSVGGATLEKMERVKASYDEAARGLAAAFADEHLAGVIGYAKRNTDLEISHLAVRETMRRQGMARALIEAVSHRNGAVELVAETDDESVGFYRAIGFSAEALPRDVNRAQRFRCRLRR